jgi:prevent-host-death family protein
MKQVNIHQAKTQLSKLLRRVAAGEEISIANRGVPVARLVPPATGKPKRQLGAYGDTIKIAGDFDDPLPDEILDAFEGMESQPPRKSKQPATEPRSKHRDPFDRMLLAQALAEGLVFLTADRNLKRYPVETFWCGTA